MNEEELRKQIIQEIKNEQKKKKKKILIIAALIIISLVGIEFSNAYKSKKQDEKSEEIIISQEEFSKYITKIPITTENWEEYIVLKDVEKENKDMFGEVANIDKHTELKFKDKIYGCILLKIKVTNKNLLSQPENQNTDILTISNCNGINTLGTYAWLKDKNTDKRIEDTTISKKNIQCIKAKGSIYIINIPEEKWQTELSDEEKSYRNVW